MIGVILIIIGVLIGAYFFYFTSPSGDPIEEPRAFANPYFYTLGNLLWVALILIGIILLIIG